MAWAIDKPPQTWLHVSVLAGNNAPSQTLSITFSVDGTDLTSGTYYANVKITPARGTPATITVKLIVV
ncbi:MAG: hypothetical protein E6J34_21295 [Chloroflexi bacterium]|nr:MAG: hypothetical protein E6J34_21295 [Chloroflexota bacterium]